MWDRRKIDMMGGWSGECDVYAGTLFVHPYPKVNPIFWTIGHVATGTTLSSVAGVFESLDDAKKAAEIITALRNDWGFRSTPDEVPALLKLGEDISVAIRKEFGGKPLYLANGYRNQFDSIGYGYRNNWRQD